MISSVLNNLFRQEIVPRAKFLYSTVKHIVLIEKLSNDLQDLINEIDREQSFAFMCPNCSGLMKISRTEPWEDWCYNCNTSWMKLFYGPQKIFKVEHSCVVWWVSATSEEEAITEVLECEKAAGCDLIKEGYWMGGGLDELVDEVSGYDAKHTTFGSDIDDTSNMWDEFVRDPSTRVMACSEW